MRTLILDTTTKSLRIKLAGNVTTNQLAFTTSYADNNGSTFTEGNQNGSTNNTTAVDMVSAPSTGFRRTIKSVTVNNLDTVSATIIVEIHNTTGSVTSQIARVTLGVNETWTLDGSYTTSGELKTSTAAPIGGSNTQVQYNNSGVLGGITGATSNGTALTITSGRATTDFSPTTNDGATLGTTSLQFADLFLASGGVINFNNGNATLTHSAGLLTSNVPLSLGTTNALTAGSIELGAASDTTISRSSAGVIAVEGVTVATASNTLTLTNKSIGSGALTLEENASVALDPSLSADGKYSGVTITGTAGATLAFGDLCYLAAADSRWELCDADSNTTAGGVLMGFCVQAAAADGDPTTMLLSGNIRADANFPTLTVGAPVYASTTPGDIQTTQPSGTDDVIQVVGFALTADSILVKISPDYITHT